MRVGTSGVLGWGSGTIVLRRLVSFFHPTVRVREGACARTRNGRRVFVCTVLYRKCAGVEAVPLVFFRKRAGWLAHGKCTVILGNCWLAHHTGFLWLGVLLYTHIELAIHAT